VKGPKTGGIREGHRTSLPCLKRFTAKDFRGVTGEREGIFVMSLFRANDVFTLNVWRIHSERILEMLEAFQWNVDCISMESH
jgi:hypothetical protein